MMPTGAPEMRAKPTTRLRAQRGPELEQLAVVDQPRGDVAHVVDLALARGEHLAGVARRRVGRRVERQPAARLGGQVRQRRADQLGRVHVVLGEEVRDAVAPVDLRAAELERGDLLARDALDHGRAGEEHLRVVAGHDREVAERGRVRRAAGARAADHADLRHRGQRLRAEDRAVGVQRRRRPPAGARRPSAGSRRPATPSLSACSIVRAIVSPPRTPSEPPLKAPSCAQAQTTRPLTRPEPDSTPSPTSERVGRKLPGSKSSSSRARATRCSGATSNTALIARLPRVGGTASSNGAVMLSSRPGRRSVRRIRRSSTAPARALAPRGAPRARSRDRTRGRATRS